jgi:hypothetical protein
MLSAAPNCSFATFDEERYDLIRLDRNRYPFTLCRRKVRIFGRMPTNLCNRLRRRRSLSSVPYQFCFRAKISLLEKHLSARLQLFADNRFLKMVQRNRKMVQQSFAAAIAHSFLHRRAHQPSCRGRKIMASCWTTKLQKTIWASARRRYFPGVNIIFYADAMFLLKTKRFSPLKLHF